LVAAAGVCLAVTEDDSLVGPISLGDGYSQDGGDNTHAVGALDGPGYSKPMYGANFPGPKYGLPGYKESHHWEMGIDLFSPVAWNKGYFAALYGYVGKMDEDLQKIWLGNLTANTAGSCPKGMINWDLNQYAANNPGTATVKDESYNDVDATCMQILENFLTTGIYQGLEGWTAFPIKTATLATSFPLSASNSNFAAGVKAPELTYTYTFWFQPTGTVAAAESNIMAYVTSDLSEMPIVSLSVAAGSTDLIYRVAQSNSPDYPCEAAGVGSSVEKPGLLEINKWYFITLVAQKFHTTSSKMILYVNGAVACEKDNTAGTTLHPQSNAELYFAQPGNPGPPSMSGMIDQLIFYPRVLTATEISHQFGVEGAKYTDTIGTV
jgi:hypothetical protein